MVWTRYDEGRGLGWKEKDQMRDVKNGRLRKSEERVDRRKPEE